MVIMVIMTFKDVRKIVAANNKQQYQNSIFYAKCETKYSGYGILKNIKQQILSQRDRCFNHVIGLPTKNGRDVLQLHMHMCIKKATGLGITELCFDI